MSTPLYPPLHTLKQVDDNIWIIDGDIINMQVAGFGVPFSTRMTIVKLKDGTLWCHSPIQAKDALLKEINQLGPVKHLISPNKIHYAYIHQWKKHYPNALSWSSPGVEKRAQSQDIPVYFDRALSDNPPLVWSQEIDQLIFKGSRVIEELVFFHKSSRTLILTDLIENFEVNKNDNKIWSRIYKLGKVAHPDGQTPLDLQMTFAGNKKEARQCLQRMLEWEPEKIIIAHGRWFESDGTTELKRAFRWLL